MRRTEKELPLVDTSKRAGKEKEENIPTAVDISAIINAVYIYDLVFRRTEQ